jgi:hypothetical protein
MANGDFVVFTDSSFPNIQAGVKYSIASGTTASINPGEPVEHALGATVVTSLATNKPVVGTDFMAGISASTSTETTTAAGKVEVYDCFSGDITFLVTPTAPTSWDTQAEYDALTGKRVLIDKTNGVYTILATDGATNGVVVMPLDISIHPGKVRVQFRKAVNYLS